MPSNRRSGRNRVLVPGAAQVLDTYKYEIANELGINYNGDKGELSSRQNGYVGGYMVRKMIQQVENQMAQGQIQPAQLAQQAAPQVTPPGTSGFMDTTAQYPQNQNQI
ncbi:MAG: alpha/beta-type small acid-soluble spore protein [Firmicutes bacterium]|nr:alpha/beta-type small acid-soluble spore protein [Bacillota bacterium]